MNLKFVFENKIHADDNNFLVLESSEVFMLSINITDRND